MNKLCLRLMIAFAFAYIVGDYAKNMDLDPLSVFVGASTIAAFVMLDFILFKGRD